MKATIQERGNGFPEVGDFVSGDGGELYRVVSIDSRIFAAQAGAPNYVHAEVELADWDDVTDDNEPVCTAVISEDEDDDKPSSEPTVYMVVDGYGNTLTDGVSEDTIREVAQSWADRNGETVYYVQSLGEDGEQVAVEPNTVHCDCGTWTGERCLWVGPREQTVVVEYMPEHLRATHTAAGNRGVYPANGAVRVRVEQSCADRLLEDETEWARIIEA